MDNEDKNLEGEGEESETLVLPSTSELRLDSEAGEENDDSTLDSDDDDDDDDDDDSSVFREADETKETSSRKRIMIREVDGTEAKKKLKRECPFCGHVVNYPSQLKRHIATHNDESRAYPCTVKKCGAEFPSYFKLRTHMKDEHPILHTCDLCPYESKSKSETRRHMIKNHVNGVPCTIFGCGMKVAKNKLIRHIREAHGDKNTSLRSEPKVRVNLTKEIVSGLKCPQCDYRPDESKTDPIMQRDDINMHVERIHLKNSVQCPLGCNKKMKVEEFEEHFKTSHNELDGLLNTNEDVSTIMSKLPKPEDSPCKSTVGDDRSLEDDISEVGDDETERNGFEEEGTSTIRNNGTKNNYFQGSYECLLCENRFMKRELLKKHVARVHEKRYTESTKRKECKFECDWKDENGKVCDKKFTTTGLLDDHINMHKGVKPYKCNSCNQSFHARARFAVHLSKYHQISIRSYTFIEDNFSVQSETSEATGEAETS